MNTFGIYKTPSGTMILIPIVVDEVESDRLQEVSYKFAVSAAQVWQEITHNLYCHSIVSSNTGVVNIDTNAPMQTDIWGEWSMTEAPRPRPKK